MWQRFFPSEADQKPLSTRFSDKKESEKIIKIIKQLREKKIELKSSSEKTGEDSLDNDKYKVVTEVLKTIDYCIDHFNAKPAYVDTIRELQASINLYRELVENINEIDREYKETLLQFRNKNREYARTGLTIGVWSGVSLALAFSSMTAGASLLVAGLGGVSWLDSQTNINSPLPETYKLIKDLVSVLKITIKNLILTINVKQLGSDKLDKLSDEDNMVCPITKDLIQDPLLFLLDGYSYERAALVKWLLNYRKSPIADKEITKSQKMEDVVVPNQYLKYVIDNYRLSMREKNGSSLKSP